QEAGIDRGHCRRRRLAAPWLLQLTGLPRRWPVPVGRRMSLDRRYSVFVEHALGLVDACRSHAGYDSRRPPVFAIDQLTGTGLVASSTFLAIITQFLATFAAIFTSVLAILATAFTPVSAVFAPRFTAFHAGRLGLGVRSAKCRGGQQRDRQPENRESVTARDHVGIDR